MLFVRRLDGGTLTGSSQQWAKLATAAQDGVEAPSMLARQVGRQICSAAVFVEYYEDEYDGAGGHPRGLWSARPHRLRGCVQGAAISARNRSSSNQNLPLVTSQAIVTRYQDNGGRLSRRNTARASQLQPLRLNLRSPANRFLVLGAG